MMVAFASYFNLYVQGDTALTGPQPTHGLFMLGSRLPAQQWLEGAGRRQERRRPKPPQQPPGGYTVEVAPEYK